MASDLAEAGIGYTILDDFHFKNAGLTQEQLHGYYVTEDDAQVINVLPGSEPLRYLLPFQPAHETIDYLRGVAESHPGSVVVFGDDGEKFGTWPGTKEHVYDRGWLVQFFRRPAGEQRLAEGDDPVRGDRQRAAARQTVYSRRQLSRDDRVVAAVGKKSTSSRTPSTISMPKALGSKSSRSSAAVTGAISR